MKVFRPPRASPIDWIGQKRELLQALCSQVFLFGSAGRQGRLSDIFGRAYIEYARYIERARRARRILIEPAINVREMVLKAAGN